LWPFGIPRYFPPFLVSCITTIWQPLLLQCL
jgi:hypothetical protein